MVREMSPCDLLGPLNLVETANAPRTLYTSGDVSLARRSPRVAIVGSRDASEDGLEDAYSLAVSLVRHGAVVVSGLARGVDTAAHTGAIDADGATIAVLGTPLNAYGVSKNKPLQDAIMAYHLAVSQFPIGAPVRPHNFPIRNRTMALICQASIIVEAGEGSGTLSQGWEALRLGRPLFLSDRVLESKSLQWPEQMMKYGAVPLPDTIDELLEILPAAYGEPASVPPL